MVNGLSTGTIQALGADFYERSTVTVAKDLLGKIIVRAVEHRPVEHKVDGSARDLRLARIVETEAYAPDDPASHAFRGPTSRNRVMFEAPGHAYVYFIYGMHHCLNAVTEPEGTGGAVLIRAAAPLYGLTAMWHSRFSTTPPERPLEGRAVRKLAGGPAMLTQALCVRTNEDNGVALYEGSLQIAHHVKVDNEGEELEFVAPTALEIVSDERVGISRAADKLWRFTVAESRFLSRKPGPASRPFRYCPQ